MYAKNNHIKDVKRQWFLYLQINHKNIGYQQEKILTMIWLYSPDEYYTIQFISFISLSIDLLHYNTESTRLAVWSSWEPLLCVWSKLWNPKRGKMSRLSSHAFVLYTENTWFVLGAKLPTVSGKYIIAFLLQLEILNLDKNK